MRGKAHGVCCYQLLGIQAFTIDDCLLSFAGLCPYRTRPLLRAVEISGEFVAWETPTNRETLEEDDMFCSSAGQSLVLIKGKELGLHALTSRTQDGKLLPVIQLCATLTRTVLAFPMNDRPLNCSSSRHGFIPAPTQKCGWETLPYPHIWMPG